MPIFGKSNPTPTTTPITLEPTRRRRTGEVRARPVSILITPPQVSERESSLYRHVDYPLGYNANASYDTTENQQRIPLSSPSSQLSSLRPSPSASPSPSPSPLSTSRSSSYKSTRPSSVSSGFSIETPLSEKETGYGPHELQQQPFTIKRKSRFIEDTELDFTLESKKSKKSSLGSLALASFSQLSLGLGSTKEKKEKKFGFRGFGMKSEIALNSISAPITMSTTAPTPVVPPRSRLRSMPAPQTTERRSSLYLLPVDPPLEPTPSLSSGSSSDQDHDESTPEPSISGRKRSSGRGSVGGDPMRIRDGAMVRKASSGLYTPTTFPGAQGPRPSHFPSHVYTPQGFTLHPTIPQSTPNDHVIPPVPSRSASSSSTTSNSSDLLTPTTPSSSRFGKTLSSFRRISNQITQSLPSPTPSPATPSPTISYFPTPTVKSGHTSWASSNYNFPTTPVNKSFGYQSPVSGGLGVGPLGEVDEEGQITSLSFDEDGEIKAMAVKVPAVKGRRKPVPKILDIDIEVERVLEGGVVHAL